MNNGNLLGPKLLPPKSGLQRLELAIGDQQIPTIRSRHRIAGIASSLVMLSLLYLTYALLHMPRSEFAVQEALTAAPHTFINGGAYMEEPSGDRNVQILIVGKLSSHSGN